MQPGGVVRSQGEDAPGGAVGALKLRELASGPNDVIGKDGAAPGARIIENGENGVHSPGREDAVEAVRGAPDASSTRWRTAESAKVTHGPRGRASAEANSAGPHP